MTTVTGYEESLRAWLPRQRWYTGGSRTAHAVRVESSTRLGDGDPGLWLQVVAVDHGHHVERYQVLVGERAELPERLAHLLIGTDGRVVWYDAAHDHDVTARLLELIGADADAGPVRFRAVPGQEPIHADLSGLAIRGEQSNTSLVFGEEYILKLFRRLVGGINPDVEVTLALAQAGSTHVAAPLGWSETDLDGVPTTLGMLQRFLKLGTDGWLLAGASVRDLYADPEMRAADAGGDFSGEAERLGAATAAVHRDLARALGTAQARTADVEGLAESVHRRLADAREELPELAPYAGPITELFDSLAGTGVTFDVQRVHGDLHLGQCMRTTAGWVLLDFEGEPARPLEERRALSSPLKDVAGMLRSFDYAAQHLLVEQGDDGRHEQQALDWAARNREAFLDGYAAESGHDPRDGGELLRIFEVDKAVYEVLYEAQHRPDWKRIPLAALDRLVG